MRVRDLMKTPVTTISPDDNLHLADGIMSLGGRRHLPVVSGGALVGILSHRDILRAPTMFFGFASDARAVLRALTVRDVMTRELVTIDADATVQAAAERLLEHKVGCLPVVENKDVGLPRFRRGALVGIVTTADLLHAIAGPHGAAGEVRVAPAPPAPAEPLRTGTRG